MIQDFPCQYPGCDRTFKHASNRTCHYNTHHRSLSPDKEPDPAFDFEVRLHPKLNALPCDANDNFLPPYTRAPTHHSPDFQQENPWSPFEDRLAFDWAYYHFAELQSSERDINKGLDLWLAAKVKAGDDVPLPWSSARRMYETIDSIQEGDAPFQTIRFKYSGVLPNNPPKWMTTAYELCTRNARILLHNQLSTPEFAESFDFQPYHQFNYKGKHVWSDFMSGDWAWNEADLIAVDGQTHGSMLVPIVAGSDKTTVSVATGHQEYHPV